jgi:hypothetical protein
MEQQNSQRPDRMEGSGNKVRMFVNSQMEWTQFNLLSTGITWPLE